MFQVSRSVVRKDNAVNIFIGNISSIELFHRKQFTLLYLALTINQLDDCTVIVFQLDERVRELYQIKKVW